MENQLAEKLIDQLAKHPGIIPPDKNMFVNMLVSTDILSPSRFYEELPDEQQLYDPETNRYHYLSLRRVLRNKNAKNYQISKLKKGFEIIVSKIPKIKVYSSDVLSRNLRVDKDLIGIMNECEHPYSLLAKFETYDFDNPDKKLYLITRPLLIIPDVEEQDIEKILNWERKNTIYEKEVGLFFRHFKKIKPAEYMLQ